MTVSTPRVVQTRRRMFFALHCVLQGKAAGGTVRGSAEGPGDQQHTSALDPDQQDAGLQSEHSVMSGLRGACRKRG